MPKLWSETIETHRRHVRDAILDTTAELVARHGLRGVTMSRIAEQAGIGRATLYKYFPDVEAILLAWHERQMTGHLGQLAALAQADGSAGQRLVAVLEAYGRIRRGSRQHHHPELTTLLHRGPELAEGQQRLHDLLRGLLIEAAAGGELRDDLPPDELATYCLHALEAAGSLRSEAAAGRLVGVVMAGLQPPGRSYRGGP